MSPRLIREGRCPHCRAELAETEGERPRTCPECGGSLQQRYLRAGCLSSKPLLLLVAATAWTLLGRGGAPAGTGEAEREARCIDASRSIHRGAFPLGGDPTSPRQRPPLEAHLAELQDHLRTTHALRRPPDRRGEPAEAPKKGHQRGQQEGDSKDVDEGIRAEPR